jgi:transcriptional regulator with XRE-family HTH domain
MNISAAEFSEWVSNALARSGLSQAALAEKLGAQLRAPMDRSKINKLVLGKRGLSAEEMIAISEICGVDLPTMQKQLPPVAVVGRVGAGARVPLIDAFEKGDGLYQVVRPPQLPGRGIVAVEVEGDSMAPMYQPGHLLFFTRHSHETVLEDDIGKPCVVEDACGMAWVKMLKRGSEAGLWNLISLNPSAESVWDVDVKWAAKVVFALPAEFAEKA